MSLVVLTYPMPSRRTGQGVTVSIDGQPVRDLVGFELKAAVDDVVRATFEVNATAPLDLHVDAQTTIVVNAVPGFEIRETPLENGGRRLQVIPVS